MKYLLLTPAVILAGIFVVWPLTEVVVMSMSRLHILGDVFVGFQNFARLPSDRAFIQSLLNSLLYTALCVPLQVGSVVAITLMASGLSKRWQDTTRFLFYIPTMCAGMIIASVWKWIWHIDGPINWILGTDIQFFSTGITAISAISITTSSASLGGFLIILLASTLSIDKSLYDAARIDGASPLQIKLRVVLPIIMPTVWLCILLSAIGAPQVIEFVLALAPYEHSATVAFDIYSTAFYLSRYGPASAKALVLLVWMLLLAFGKSRITRAT